MTSAEKQSKKSTKFNYLAANNIKQQLLGRYETLNFEQSLYKRNYDTNVIEKNKENLKESINQDFIDESKYVTKNDTKKIHQKKESLKQRLVSFRQNKPQQDNVSFSKEDQHSIIFNRSQILEGRKQKGKIENVNRTRNKSFGNISFKKPELENSRHLSHKKKAIQFSPYQEQKRLKQKMVEDCSNKFKSIELQRFQENPAPRPQQKLLIYQLQEQQLIIKKQLKEYQYQNQLLRQKIQYLQSDNLSLRQANQKHKEEVQSQQIYYQQLLDTQSVNITQLHQQVEMLNAKVAQYQTLINQDQFLIKDLQNEIKNLNLHIKELDMLLDSKQQIIHELKTKIQILTFNQKQTQFIQRNLTKRRKSLDLSTQLKKSPNKQYQNQTNISCKNCLSSGNSSSEFKTTLNTSSIGKLINKTFNPTLYTIQENKLLEKKSNFIESIKSMYLKINNKQNKDLKQLWKWLKFIAHQYQSFTQLYTFRDSILTVLDDFEARNLDQQSEYKVPLIEKECFKIIKTLAQMVTKCNN